MKIGFTIIEFIIGMLIASIILTTLLASFYNLNSVIRVSEDIVDLDTRAAIIQNQMAKDLSGAFAPQQDMPMTQTVQKNEQQQKEKSKGIEDVFTSKNKQDRLDMLTFISNNPLIVYVQKRLPESRIVRIVYRLVENPDKRSFKLIRQQGTDLSLKSYDLKTGKIKGYTLADLVKQVTIEYKTIKTSKEKDKKMEFAQSKQWPPEKKEKENHPILPQFATITVTLWDNEIKEDRSFTFYISIPGAVRVEDQAAAAERQPKNDEAAKKSSQQQEQKAMAAMVSDMKKMANAFRKTTSGKA